MDHGAQNTVGGERQYKAYSKHTKIFPGTICPSNRSFRFGNRTTKSLGVAMIRFPTDDNGGYFEYPSDIVSIDVPLLFGLDLMKKYKIRVDEVENKIEQREQGWSARLVSKKGHLYREWPTGTVMFSRSELAKLHRRFAHPSTAKLMNLLQRATPEEVNEETRKVLEKIYRS